MKEKFNIILDACQVLTHPATAGAGVPFNNSEVGGVGELGSKATPHEEKQERRVEQYHCCSNKSCQACVVWHVDQVGDGEIEVDEDRQSGDRVCWGARVNSRK